MIIVTEGAKEGLRGALLAANLPDPDMGLRLSLGDSGEFQLEADTAQEDDQVTEHQGSKILMLDKETAAMLDGFTIDCENTIDGPSLVFLNPHGSCSCGECDEDSCC